MNLKKSTRHQQRKNNDLRALNNMAEPSPCHEAPNPVPMQESMPESVRTSGMASQYLKATDPAFEGNSSAVDPEKAAAVSAFPKRLTRDSRSRSARRAMRESSKRHRDLKENDDPIYSPVLEQSRKKRQSSEKAMRASRFKGGDHDRTCSKASEQPSEGTHQKTPIVRKIGVESKSARSGSKG